MYLRHLDWDSIPVEQLSPLLTRQFITTENLTLARFFLKRGCVVPSHHHPNEQLAMVLSGALRFVVDGSEVIVRSGESLCIPPNIPHSAEALEDTIDIDVFCPPRQDWLNQDDAYLR